MNRVFNENSKLILSYFPHTQLLEIIKINKYLQKLFGFSKQTYQFKKFYENEVRATILKVTNPKQKHIVKRNYKAVFDITNTNFLHQNKKIFLDTNYDVIYSFYFLTKNQIILSSTENKIKIYDISSQKCVKVITEIASPVFKFTNDFSSLDNFITVSLNGEVIRWSKSNFTKVLSYCNNTSGVVSFISVSRLKKYIISYWDLSIEIFDLENCTITIQNQSSQPIISFAYYFNLEEKINYILFSSRNQTIVLNSFSNNSLKKIKSTKVGSFDDVNKYITFIFPLYYYDKIMLGYSNGSISSMNIEMTKSFWSIKPFINSISNMVEVSNNIIAISHHDKNLCVFDALDIKKRIVISILGQFDCFCYYDSRIIFSSKNFIKNLCIEVDDFTMKIEGKIISIKENKNIKSVNKNI